MGAVQYAAPPVMLETLLGSCVGVAIWDRMTKQAGLAHIVLPECKGQRSHPGKYADLAIEEIITQLVARGAMRAAFRAKIAGGATMFQTRGARDIGGNNSAAVREQLSKFNIPLDGKHVGGTKGRVMSVSLEKFEVSIKIGKEQVATF